jgi:Ca2+-binding EF-hand superfamily protein
MAPKKKSGEIPEKRPVQEIRAEIRSYIQNERDTILKKWLALKESIKSEDYRRTQFQTKKLKQDTKSLPMNILKFIGTLKKSVRHTMRYKGGTPYSIIRSLFLYWDADKSGRISADEMIQCMNSLGAKVTYEDCEEIVKYYAGNDLSGEMDYRELLQDIQVGEPSVIAFVTQSEDDERDHNELRFEEVADKFVQMPPIVVKFLEAVRSYLATTMRNIGGTPFQHIQHLFQFYDYDYSHGLLPKELVLACRRKMKLAITLDQAQEIVDYYDRKGKGEIVPEKFIEDVCIDVKPILSFTELSPRSIAASKKSLAVNPFIPKPFAAPANKVLEKFKQDVKIALVNKVNKLGGTVASWIREAFITWDPTYSTKISRWDHLQGAAKRLGVTISDDEAKVLITCYDKHKTGEMHYHYLAEEIMQEDAHFLMDAKMVDRSFSSTSRTPPQVVKVIQQFKKACDLYVSKSKGRLEARDLMHGTFLRFDPTKSGFVNIEGFKAVVRELKVSGITVPDMIVSAKWFDTNGSQDLDYNSMIRQMYGSDVTTESLRLPVLKESVSMSAVLNRSFGESAAAKYSAAGSSAAAHSSGGGGGGGGMAGASSVPNFMGASLGGPTMMERLPTIGSGFGCAHSTLEKNLEVVESQAVKQARIKMKRHKIIAEKVKVERKLASIEEQKKKIIEDYKARRNK